MAQKIPLHTPGVYIEEQSTLAPIIEGVETDVPAFVGYTEKSIGPAGESLRFKPFRVHSLLEYTQYFGEAQPEKNSIQVEIQDVVQNFLPDPALETLISRDIQISFDFNKRSKFNLFYALQLFFSNGGSSCYIVSVGNTPAKGGGKPTKSKLLTGLNALEPLDEPTMLLIPEAIHSGEPEAIYQAALLQAATRKDRMVIMDLKQSTNPETDLLEFRSGIHQHLKYGAAYYPHLDTSLNIHYQASTLKIKHQKKDSNGHSKPGLFHKKTLSEITHQGLQQSIIVQINQKPLTLPPSPAVAGVWSRVDQQRGVWKAPANEALFNVIRPLIAIDDELQEGMNVDIEEGKSVNAIRAFTGRGIKIWGARTLAGNDNEWRYISVVRFCQFVQESLQKGLQNVVFEPNDPNTWTRVKIMIEDFLRLQWQNGALMGSTTNEAFFIRVGLGQTMTELDVLEGRLLVDMGMAIIRPAEFLILKLSFQLEAA